MSTDVAETESDPQPNQSAPSENLPPNRAGLMRLMADYGRLSERWQACDRRYALVLNQGVVGLLLAILLAAAGAWSLLTMVAALLATWRISQSFAIDDQCQLLETQTDQAREALDQALTHPVCRNWLPELYEELAGESFQGQLGFYLPGPVEVGRHLSDFRLQQLLSV